FTHSPRNLFLTQAAGKERLRKIRKVDLAGDSGSERKR
ncbi:unnamed protein product, partial [Linum tenue]